MNNTFYSVHICRAEQEHLPMSPVCLGLGMISRCACSDPATSEMGSRLSCRDSQFGFVLSVLGICFVVVQKHNILHFASRFSQRLEIRAQVADAFLSKFQLTSDEMTLLRGTRGGPVTEVWACLPGPLRV